MASRSGRNGVDAAVASLHRRRWVALAVFTLVLAASLSFAWALPNLYQASATVLVERPASAGGADDLESRLQTIRQEILSRARLTDLIARFDLYPTLRPVVSPEALVEHMRHDVKIEATSSDLASGRGTIAFALSYRGADPAKVTQVANALTSSYIEEDSRVRDRQSSGAAAVLRTQLDDVKKRLSTQETQIAEFKRTHAGELPQQADASFIAVERLNGQLQKVSEARAAAVEKRATLQRESAEPGADADPDRARLARLTQELAALRTKFSDRYPDVVNKKAEVDNLAAAVAAKPAVDRALPQLEQLNREIRGLQAEEARLRGEVSMYENRVAGAPFREQQYQALSRDYTTTRDFYDSLLKRYEEAQLSEAREEGPQGQRLRLLDSAIPPTEPLAPDRIRLAVFGLIAAGALAVIGIALAEKLDTSFHSADELGVHTRVPILVRIPRMPNDNPAAKARARRRAAALGIALLIGVGVTTFMSRKAAEGNEGIVALLAPRGRS